jgi:hypothetical protein
MRLNSLIIGVLLSWVAACGPQPSPQVTCPGLGGAAANLPLSSASLDLNPSSVVSGALTPGEFVVHPFNANPNSTITLTLTLEAPNIGGVLFVYGPRKADGTFDECRQESAQGEPGDAVHVVLNIGDAQWGEYRALVSGKPVLEANGAYSLEASCTGPGCGESQCPALVCPVQTCQNGFVFDENNCPTCECTPIECDAFKTLINGECRCNCPLTPDDVPVCGVNSKTYKNQCMAACEGVVTAFTGPCDQQCEILSPIDCPNVCEFGYEIQDGCLTCNCVEDVCAVPDPKYAPVCGKDGLTYTNRFAATTCAGQGVGYIGPCLPYCSLPKNCDLDCEFGLKPHHGLGSKCFQCQCLGSPPDVPVEFWCGRRSYIVISTVPLDDGSQPPGNDGDPNAGSIPGAGDLSLGQDALTLAVHLSQFRTFPSKQAVNNANNWTPMLKGPCPTGACLKQSDCNTARAYVRHALNTPANGTPNLQPAAPSSDWKVECVRNGQNAIGRCKLIESPSCNLGTMPVTPDADSEDAACDNDYSVCVLTPQGPECKSADGCGCLNTPAGQTYDPVCVGGDDALEHEYYNACHAFCAGAWPITRPGKCCDGSPQSNGDVLASFETLQTYCAESGDLSVHFILGNACPPEPDSCEEEEGGVSSICCVPSESAIVP